MVPRPQVERATVRALQVGSGLRAVAGARGPGGAGVRRPDHPGRGNHHVRARRLTAVTTPDGSRRRYSYDPLQSGPGGRRTAGSSVPQRNAVRTAPARSPELRPPPAPPGWRPC
ncbi:RHS repeat domain-containing protein [Streptomyces sp. NPDC046759]|uniref:RHS repeat domain-containing protein n=1 Tax=Streptomyces sp. NPDC046759 TaxID=3155019 RepID=UPI0033EA878F